MLQIDYRQVSNYKLLKNGDMMIEMQNLVQINFFLVNEIEEDIIILFFNVILMYCCVFWYYIYV